MNSFSRDVDLLHRALDVSSLRYQVSANNLANSEVPNFKRSSVTFESELTRAMEREKNAGEEFTMLTSDPRHIQSTKAAASYQEVTPKTTLDYTSTSKANGNNVDAEEEAMLILKTQLQYQLLTQMENFEFSQVKTVLKR